MKVEDTKKNNILINGYPSNLNLEILIELIKQSKLDNKNDLLKEWEELKSFKIKKTKDYELKNKVEMFKIKLIESLVFTNGNMQ